jgi:hypothetical protein
LQEFKEWVENIDKNETDYSKVQAVINSFWFFYFIIIWKSIWKTNLFTMCFSYFSF